MVDTKITALTSDAAPTGDDLILTVNAPGTTPANRKVALSAVQTLFEAGFTITESQISDLKTYQLQLAEGPFVAGDKTKLDGVEASADVTDETNVLAALSGAVTTGVTPAAGDKVLVLDASDLDNVKHVLYSAFSSGGGATVTTGAGAPVSTPAAEGDLYIDTTADEVYVAVGIVSSADWAGPVLVSDGVGSLTVATAVAADALIFGDASDSDTAKQTTITNFLTDLKVIRADATDTLEVGYANTTENIGTVSTGTTTLVIANGNLKRLVNNGAFTLAPPTVGDGVIILEVENAASAGTITTSGFTSITGDTLNTTLGNIFLCTIVSVNGRHWLSVVADSGNT